MEFYKETKFKSTEIGRIPKNWNVVKVNRIGRLKDGDWILKKYYTSGGVRLLQIGDIGTGEFLDVSSRFVSYETAEKLDCTFVNPEEDILISRMPDPIGRSCLPPRLSHPYIVAVDITIFTLDKNQGDPRFMVYDLNSVRMLKEVRRLSSGATRQRISRKNLENLKIPLPPLPEQQKIASTFCRIDETIQKTNELIQKTQELKKGLTQQLLTKGIGHKEFKDSEIGRIPKQWEVVRLEEVASKNKNAIKRGPWGGSLRKEMFVDAGYKVYEQKNVIYNDFSIGDYFISEEKFNELKDFAVKEGDILLTSAGTIGKIAIVPKNSKSGIINQALFKISLDCKKMLVSYFKFLFGHEIFHRTILSSSHGATMKNISSTKALKNLPLPLPSVTEQQKISEVLLSVDEKIEKEKQTKQQLEKLKEGLMRILLTGKVRVR